MGKAFILHIVGSVVLEKSCCLVIAVQTVEGSYPDIAKIIFTTSSYEVGRYTVRILRVVSQVLNSSVCFYPEESFLPAAYP